VVKLPTNGVCIWGPPPNEKKSQENCNFPTQGGVNPIFFIKKNKTAIFLGCRLFLEGGFRHKGPNFVHGH